MLAVDRALEAARQPKQLLRQSPQPLPPDMLDVIKCAAGDEMTLARYGLERGLHQDSIRDAARVYLQHIVTHANGSDRLVLGLTRSATANDVREHKRWMLKWLHPDRNPSKWEANLFHRVKEASARLENGAGREPEEKPSAQAFSGKRDANRRRTLARQPAKPSRPPLKPARMRKRDVLRLIVVPMLLAGCTVAIAAITWFRFGPQGGP